MGFLDFFRRSEPQAVNRPLAAGDAGVILTTSDALESYLRGQSESHSGASVTSDSSMRVAAVFRCISIIAGATASMPVKIRRRVDEHTRAEVDVHPAARVIRRRPNQWQTPVEWRRLMQAHALLRGNGMSLKVMSRGRLVALLPLNPDRVRIEQRDDMTLEYVFTRKDGRQVTFPQGEIFHLRGLSLDGVRGVSVLTYAREAIGLSLQTEKHGAKLFKNGTTLGGHLKHPGQLGEEGLSNLRESLEKFKGAENAHKWLITEEAMEFTSMAMTSEDAQFLETRKFQRSEIAMFFGVPPHMLGDTEKSTSWGTGIEQQGIGFVTYTLQDWLTTWEQTIDRDLIGDDDEDIYTKLISASLVRGDIKARFEAYVKSLQWGIHNPNEIRAMEDENPREGGDRYYEPPNTAGTSTDEPSPDPDDPLTDPNRNAA